MKDRYDAMPRETLDAELRIRVASAASAVAFARSGRMADEDVRNELRQMDAAAEMRDRRVSEW